MLAILEASHCTPPYLANGSATYLSQSPGGLGVLAGDGRIIPLFVAKRDKLLLWVTSRATLLNVCFGSLADISLRNWHVRFPPNSRHSQPRHRCLLSANNGHSPTTP